MKVEEYNLMTNEQRYMCWLDRSVPVATTQDSFMTKVLYQLDSFYVEMRFLKSSPEQSYFIVFSDTSLLDDYLKTVDIDNLLKH